mgnify:CR=1 FL=1
MNVWLLIGLELKELSNISQRKEAHILALNPVGAFFVKKNEYCPD